MPDLDALFAVKRAGATIKPLNRVLSALPTAELSLLSPFLREVALPSGTILYESDDPIDRVYFPHSIVVSILAGMRDGTTVGTAAIGCEATLGTGVAFDRRRAIGTMLVKVTGSAACIHAADFQLCAAKSDLLREIAARCDALLMKTLHQNVACNSLHGAEARMARCLLEYGDRLGSTLTLTQDCLAQMLSVRRTTATLAAQTLQASGAISYRRGVVQLVDRAALEAAACECYGIIQAQTRSLLSDFPKERRAGS